MFPRNDVSTVHCTHHGSSLTYISWKSAKLGHKKTHMSSHPSIPNVPTNKAPAFSGAFGTWRLRRFDAELELGLDSRRSGWRDVKRWLRFLKYPSWIHGTNGIFTCSFTIQNQPFMLVHIPFPWISHGCYGVRFAESSLIEMVNEPAITI